LPNFPKLFFKKSFSNSSRPILAYSFSASGSSAFFPLFYRFKSYPGFKFCTEFSSFSFHCSTNLKVNFQLK